MPARPSNITGVADLVNTLNQNIREMQIRIDRVAKVIPRHRIVGASGTLDFGSVPAGGSVERNINLTGAKQSGSVSASPQLQIGGHLTWSAYIPGNDVVTVRLSNPTGSPIMANTVKWNASVVQ